MYKCTIFRTLVQISLKHISSEFFLNERNNSYYFSRANRQKAGTKIYSFTQCRLTVNEFDWHIFAGNDERINSHCLTRVSLNSATSVTKNICHYSKRAPTCHFLCERPGCYYSTSKTHVEPGSLN